MTQADIDRMVTEALQRLNYFINRKAGQQIRRMKSAQRKNVLKAPGK